MITPTVIDAIAPSLATAYGKNGLPWPFMIEYSRRYCSRSRLFTPASDLLGEQVLLLGLQPRRRRGAELRDQVEVSADQRDDQARDEEHVQRVEAADRGWPELRSRAQEVGQVGAHDRARGVQVHG